MTTAADDSTLLGDVLSTLAAHRPGADPRPLDKAIDEIEAVLADPEFPYWDTDTKAYVWLLGGGATILRSRTDSADPADLDHAIAMFEYVYEAAGTADLDRHFATVNLATALTDRFTRDHSRPDIDRARLLLPAAIVGLRQLGRRVDIALHDLGLCLYASWEDSGVTEDLDEAVMVYREALACPEPDDDERSGYLNSLGVALRAKGRLDRDATLLIEAADAYIAARGGMPLSSVNRRHATVNIAGLYLDRYRDEAIIDLLHEAVQFYREAYREERAWGGSELAKITDNLGVALRLLYRSTGELDLLRSAAGHFHEAATLHPAGSTGWATAIAGFASVLVDVYDRTARLVMLDRAVSHYQRLVDNPSSRTPERCQGLGVCLVKRYRRTDSRVDLEQALALLAEAARSLVNDAYRGAALNSEAHAWSVRFNATTDRRDIDRAIALTEEALTLAPGGSLDMAQARSNLGVHLLERFKAFGDTADLDRALAAHEEATADAPSGDQTIFVAALADILGQYATADPIDETAHRATEAYRRSVTLARERLPEQALGAAYRWGRWAASRDAWAEASEAYELSLEAMRGLVLTQESRGHKESWLRDASDLPRAAAVALVRAGLLERAVLALEGGRAMLLSEAMRPPS